MEPGLDTALSRAEPAHRGLSRRKTFGKALPWCLSIALVSMSSPWVDDVPATQDDLATLPVPVSHAVETPNRPAETPDRPVLPNIVIILTDDMRRDELAFMPSVQTELIRPGVKFTNAFVVNPICCPSRASLLTGQYSHSNRVYTNDRLRFGAWRAFAPHETDTVATRLTDRYETALVGKYLNAYKGDDAEDVPPGWDDWIAFSNTHGNGGAYDRYSLIVKRPKRAVRVERFGAGASPSTYSTDVLANMAEEIIRENLSGPDPLFLLFTPFAPHGRPVPPSRYESAPVDIGDDAGHRFGPSLNEPDVSDKPGYLRGLPLLSDSLVDRLVDDERQRIRTLLAVDDAVAGIIRALKPEIANTLFIFTSDNGMERGEHRWRFKDVPYDASIHVPFVLRYDQLASGVEIVPGVVANIDIAPTLMELTGGSTIRMDGLSLLPLLHGASKIRSAILVEHLRHRQTKEPSVPSYCALRTRHALFVRYATGEEEFYDYRRDPYELRNVISSPPARASLVARFRRSTRELCDPLPPGMAAF